MLLPIDAYILIFLSEYTMPQIEPSAKTEKKMCTASCFIIICCCFSVYLDRKLTEAEILASL